MYIWTCFITFTAASLLSSAAFAHGEDRPGPHHGYIKMPGTYHVEVIPSKNSLDIMLLDINFKNPTALNSSVKAIIKTSRKNTYVLNCESMDNYFTCPVNEKILSKKGKLLIESARLQEEGAPVEYALPLRFEKIV